LRRWSKHVGVTVHKQAGAWGLVSGSGITLQDGLELEDAERQVHDIYCHLADKTGGYRSPLPDYLLPIIDPRTDRRGP
jgi:hypothetical protein